MSWGKHISQVEEPFHLLYWTLLWVIGPYGNAPIDCFLEKILGPEGGLGGDPGWEIDHLPEQDSEGSYRVWADFDVSGIEPAEKIYSAKIFRQAIRESLIFFGEAYPEKMSEVVEVIKRYGL
jgi:hypothetical protein